VVDQNCVSNCLKYLLLHERKIKKLLKSVFTGSQKISVAEPHHFYAAPAPGKIFDATPASAAPVALALAPTLLHSKAKFF
jgi:hypothetical protein